MHVAWEARYTLITSLWRWFCPPLLTFFTLYLLPITLLSLCMMTDSLHGRGRGVEGKNRNGRRGECSRQAGPLCSGVGLALRGNIMGIFSLFYIHRHNLLNTHNPQFPYHKLFFLLCFFSVFQSLLARCFFLDLRFSRGSPSQMSPWDTTALIDFLPAALIWTHSLYRCKNRHFYSPGC